MKFYQRVKGRGWDAETLKAMFVEAHEKTRIRPEARSREKEDKVDNKHRMILHLEYHPDDIPRKLLRNAWSKHCGEFLSQKPADGGIGLKETIIAYSRPRNLKDMLMKAKLQEHAGYEVSSNF